MSENNNNAGQDSSSGVNAGATATSARSEAGGVTFQSRYANYRIHLEHPTKRVGVDGKLLVEDYGGAVQFENFRFTTRDRRQIAELKKASGFGSDFWELNSARVAEAHKSAGGAA